MSRLRRLTRSWGSASAPLRPPGCARRRPRSRRGGDHRVEVELGDLRQLLAEHRESVEEVDERGRVGGRGPRKPPTRRPALPPSDQLLRVDVRERCDAEVRLADQLGEHAAGPEGHERSEDRILDDSCEQLRAAADHGLDDHGAADPLHGGRTSASSREIERHAARLRLVRAGLGRLHDDGEPELGGRCGAASSRSRPRARGRAGSRRSRVARAPRPASSQPSSPRASAPSRPVRAGEVDAVELRHRARPAA